jgi:hypothetical protein
MPRLCGENASRHQSGQLAKDGPRSETVRQEISPLNGRADTPYPVSSHRLAVIGHRHISVDSLIGVLAGNGDGGDGDGPRAVPQPLLAKFLDMQAANHIMAK